MHRHGEMPSRTRRQLPFVVGAAAGTHRGERPIVNARIRARFRDGDPDAVRTVYQAYGPLVFAVAYQALGQHSLAEEATQQTFVNAWRAAARFDVSRDLAPWLVRIARHVAIDFYRRESRFSGRSRETPAPIDAPAASAAPSPEHLHAIWEIRRAISELPGDEREVVHRQHLEGLTHAQIASRLRIPVGTVKSRSFRAHKRLIAALRHLQ